MNLELFPVHRSQLEKGEFPLNHDCILKVEYKDPYLVKYQYMTCRAIDSGVIVQILQASCAIRKIYVSDVDSFGL